MSDSTDLSSSDSEDNCYMYNGFLTHRDLLSEPEPRVTVGIELLKDLAAQEASKHWGCDELEKNTTLTLDDHILERICAKAFPVDQRKLKSLTSLCSTFDHCIWDHAEYLVRKGAVKECRQIGFSIVAHLEHSETGKMRVTDQACVSIKFEKQQITFVSCSRCMKEFWCKHILAAIIYRTWFPEKVPVQSPMTETLMQMSRDQLLKLILFTANTNPSHILPLYETIEELNNTDSDISRANGAPDPTYDGSNGDMGERLWQLSLRKLKSNIKREIRYDEADSEFFQTLFSKCTDLVRNNETYKACEVLVCLASVVADPSNHCMNYALQLDVRMASFILSFDGEGREHLVHALRNFHHSSVAFGDIGVENCEDKLEEALCLINLPSHDETDKTDDIKVEPEETFLFLKSLRAEKFNSISLHRLEKENFTSEISEEPIQVMLFRLYSLETFAHDSCDHTNYRTMILRKCIQMKDQMLSGILGSTPLYEGNPSEDTEAGPSQCKSRRIDRTQHQGQNSSLSLDQFVSVTLYLLGKIDTRPPFRHPSLIVEALLCLKEIQQKLKGSFGSMYNDYMFTLQWRILTSIFEESIRNKTFMELFSSVVSNHWKTFYSDGNRGLLTLLTTADDLPIDWRAQLCGDVVCSVLENKSTKDLDSAEPQVDVNGIVQMVSLVVKFLKEDGSTDCSDTATKILEACLVCSNEKTSRLVFGVFLRNQSQIRNVKHVELMLHLLFG